MELLKLLLAPHATPALAVMAETGLLGGVLGGVPLLASFENMAKVEAATGIAPDAVRRLGALGVFVKEDAERLAQRLRLSNAEAERLLALDCWWRVSPAAGDASRACAPLSARAASLSPIACCWPGRAPMPARRTRHGASLRPCRSAGRRRSFRSRRRTSSAAALPRARRLGAALRAAEEAWIEADFPADQAAIEAIADRAAREAAASG